jgi:translation initiation factor 2 subunit 2
MSEENSIYGVSELVSRAYTKLEEMGKTHKKEKMVVEPPHVKFENKKTYFNNFRIVAQNINRKELELQSYYDSELSCKSSIEANGSLKITGRYRQDNIMNVLTRYIQNYVLCGQCGGSNTEIIKEGRIKFLMCNDCMAKKAY